MVPPICRHGIGPPRGRKLIAGSPCSADRAAAPRERRALFDLTAEEIGGIAVVAALGEAHPPATVIAVTGHDASPARNRVTPTGDIEAIPLRGAWTGNRGILHSGREIVRFHASDLWITCALKFRGRWHEQWQPHHFTWLYFHDEAVSFAAGHRPCAECRRPSYNAYRAAWADALGVEPPSAKQINGQLHGERIVRGTHRRRIHALPWADLPDGTFVLLEGSPSVVVRDHLFEWTRDGYSERRARPTQGTARVITPPSTVAALRAGYQVQIDDAALVSTDP